jgi:hypothetical protein
LLPAGSLSLIEPSYARTAPPLVPTEFPPIEPVQTADTAAAPAYAAAYATQMPGGVPV